MKTAEDSYTITIKQIVRFQERMHFEKFQVDEIQNGHYSPGHKLGCANTGFLLFLLGSRASVITVPGLRLM